LKGGGDIINGLSLEDKKNKLTFWQGQKFCYEGIKKFKGKK